MSEQRFVTTSEEPSRRSRRSRRLFLQRAASGALAVLTPPKLLGLSSGAHPITPRPSSPDEAIRELLRGNQRFARNQLTSLDQDLALLKARTVEKQEPFAAILACADSRVPVELVFDQTIGHVFVARVAGNIATPEIIASLEYAVAVLGIQVLVVLGHTNCGAVKAALKTDEVPGQISSLYSYLRPGIAQSAGAVDKAISANARVQAELLRSSSTVIRAASSKGTVKIVSGVYDLGTGLVALS